MRRDDGRAGVAELLRRAGARPGADSAAAILARVCSGRQPAWHVVAPVRELPASVLERMRAGNPLVADLAALLWTRGAPQMDVLREALDRLPHGASPSADSHEAIGAVLSFAVGLVLLDAIEDVPTDGGSAAVDLALLVADCALSECLVGLAALRPRDARALSTAVAQAVEATVAGERGSGRPALAEEARELRRRVGLRLAAAIASDRIPPGKADRPEAAAPVARGAIA